jgi:hypothetical protein
MARAHSRETLAEVYVGYRGGDQILNETEERVGASSRELDRLAQSWTFGGSDLPAGEILAQVDSIIVTPGSNEP